MAGVGNIICVFLLLTYNVHLIVGLQPLFFTNRSIYVDSWSEILWRRPLGYVELCQKILISSEYIT